MICTSEKANAYFLSKDVSILIITIFKNFFGFFHRHINKDYITEQVDLKGPFYNQRVESVMSTKQSQGKVLTVRDQKFSSEYPVKGAINTDIANITAIDIRGSDFKGSLNRTNFRSP